MQDSLADPQGMKSWTQFAHRRIEIEKRFNFYMLMAKLEALPIHKDHIGQQNGMRCKPELLRHPKQNYTYYRG